MRQIKHYMARNSRLDPAAELYDVTITTRERRTSISGQLLTKGVDNRLAWVVTIPWRYYALGGDAVSTTGRREQHVAIIDAKTGDLLAIDIIDARDWVKP